MGDYGVKVTASDAPLRTIAFTMTETVAEAVRRHGTWPTASAALGRLLVAAALFGALTKDERRVTLRLLGDGPLGTLIADAQPNGDVRGYVQNPHVHLPLTEQGKLNVGEAVGRNGYFAVARDYGTGRPYVGSSPLVSGEVGEDVAHYFYHSEQIPSVVSLGVLVAPDGSIRAAGGIIVQAMPGYDQDVLNKLEENAKKLHNISKQIDEGATAEDLTNAALHQFSPKLQQRLPVRFACHCSSDRIKTLLAGFDDKELLEMANSDKPTEVRCHFCNETYTFSREEVLQLRSGR